MHFLGLHGIGSNVERFQAQIAAITAELGDEHTYDFPNGPLLSPPDSELFKQLASTKSIERGSDACYSYFDWYSAQSILDAIEWLSAYIEENGPYDGVVAFSQGTCLAATLMLQQKTMDPDVEPLFRCAVFFSGILPLSPEALCDGRRVQFGPVSPSEAAHCDNGEDGLSTDNIATRTTESDMNGSDGTLNRSEPFQIPSTHVWGTNDSFPLPQGERLSHLFAQHLRTNITHEEGHAVPGAKNLGGVRKIVRAIRRTTERTLLVH